MTNRRRPTPVLAVGSGETSAVLTRNIRLELVLARAILLITAVLAHTAPPIDPSEHDPHNHAHEAAPDYTVVTVSRGWTLALEVALAHVGTNGLTLWLADADGQPLAPVEVMVALSPPAAGIEPLVRALDRSRGGRYALPHLDLPIAGRWRLRVDALISDFEKVIFTT